MTDDKKAIADELETTSAWLNRHDALLRTVRAVLVAVVLGGGFIVWETAQFMAETRHQLQSLNEKVDSSAKDIDTLRETVFEKFAEVDERLGKMDERLNKMSERLSRIEGKLGVAQSRTPKKIAPASISLTPNSHTH